jgi:hypothetical protein
MEIGFVVLGQSAAVILTYLSEMFTPRRRRPALHFWQLMFILSSSRSSAKVVLTGQAHHSLCGHNVKIVLPSLFVKIVLLPYDQT